MKRVFKITTTITILDESSILDLFEIKKEIQSGQFQRDMEKGKKCKVIATFEEIINKNKL